MASSNLSEVDGTGLDPVTVRPSEPRVVSLTEAMDFLTRVLVCLTKTVECLTQCYLSY